MNDQFHYKLITSDFFKQLFDNLLVAITKPICNHNVLNNGGSGMHAFISVFTVASDPSNS